MKYKILIIACALFFCMMNANSKSIVSINDTVLTRGMIYKLPIYFSTDLKMIINSIEVGLKFNAKNIMIKEIITGEGYIINESPENLYHDYNDVENTLISIKSDKLNLANNKLCDLIIEAYQINGGLDSISITSLKINDSDFSNSLFELKNSILTLNENPVLDDNFEYFSNNYPNPFSDKTNINFYLKHDTKLNFSIYSINGKKSFDLIDLKNSVNIKIKYLNNNEDIEFSNDLILKKGDYTLELNPTSWMMSSGAYFVVFRTDNQVHKINIMYRK